MSDAGGQLVGIEPPEIRFLSGGSEDETSCLLQVSNQTDNYVAFKFKVKTMQVKWYCIKPKSGVLEPRSQREVVVTKKVLKGADYSDILCKDMFMLQCVRVNANTTVADVEKMMFNQEAGGHQVKKLSVVFVPPDQPCSPVKASEVASSPGSSMSGTGNCSSFRPDTPSTTVFKEVTGITDEMAKLSPTASTASICVEDFLGEFLKAKSLEEPILTKGGGGDADDREASLLMADANCQDEEEKEEPILPEGGVDDADDLLMADANCQDKEEEPILLKGGGGDAYDQKPNLLMADANCPDEEEKEELIQPEGAADEADGQEASLLMADANCQVEEDKEELVLPEGGGGDVDDQEGVLHVMNIDANCQEEEEEPILPEGGGCDADDQDHINQELDYQNQSGLCPGHGTSNMQLASNGGRPDIDPSRENQLPFRKTLPIWENIESWEAFRLLPQRPHFRPLVELDPEIREQEAIKFMVGFATLVGKIAALKPDVSIGLLHHYLKQLDDLELFGFEVKVAVDRLTSLLAIQKRRGLIRRRRNDVRDRITKKAEDKVKLEEGIKQMDRELKEAQSKQASRMSLKQLKEAEADSFELELSNVNEKISIAEDQFKALVSAPW